MFHIDTNSIIVSNYKYLGVFEWRLNYKSSKTWFKLLEFFVGGKGAVKLSFTFNWLNVCKAGGVASSLWFIGSVFVVSLNKYLFASSPTGYKKSQCASCFTERHSQTSKCPPLALRIEPWGTSYVSAHCNYVKSAKVLGYEGTVLVTDTDSL